MNRRVGIVLAVLLVGGILTACKFNFLNLRRRKRRAKRYDLPGKERARAVQRRHFLRGTLCTLAGA